MEAVLWLVAVALVVYGIVSIIRGNILLGVVLIIVGLLVGPGGVASSTTMTMTISTHTSYPGGHT